MEKNCSWLIKVYQNANFSAWHCKLVQRKSTACPTVWDVLPTQNFSPPTSNFRDNPELNEFLDRRAAEPSSLYGWPPSVKLTMGFSIH